ncbi:MAG: D-glycero-beta-D-manno-heptose-7-phosphate kinase [Alphaproteobacteria bacterium]|nr:D-glycero-beta-D-manno-heptose-7-phosphate kinase [Alphaproteobacteria bacterium]
MLEDALINRLTEARIAVIGDVMLDHHVVGRVSRISPEAPVPVLQVQSERSALGGAANVAANIAALGGAVDLIGLVGEDAAAAQLVQLMETAYPTIAPRLVAVKGRPTVTKTRYLGGQHQIVRVDRERVTPMPAEIEEELIEELREALDACALLVISDYAKGVMSDAVLSAALALAKAAGKPSIVDPKRLRLADYRGASILKPNRKELAEAVGLPCETDQEAEAAAQAAIQQSGAAILLTRSEKGMTLYQPQQKPLHLPADAREVFDVSGAGDTAVAGLALGIAAKLSIEQAMRIANAAAGVAVSKLGTAVVTANELAAALRVQGRGAPVAAGRAVSDLEQALALRERWRREGLVVGFANGCFDLLHAGHAALIAQAAQACDRLIVALNADSSVRRLKGPTRPVQPLAARAAVIGAMKGVDLVVSFEDDTPLALIEALLPDVLVKGEDYAEAQVVGGDVVKAHGGRVLLARLTEGQSTSAIVDRARTGA